MSNDILCVDLGGTNMRVAVVDERGQIRCRANEPTLVMRGAPRLLNC